MLMLREIDAYLYRPTISNFTTILRITDTLEPWQVVTSFSSKMLMVVEGKLHSESPAICDAYKNQRRSIARGTGVSTRFAICSGDGFKGDEIGNLSANCTAQGPGR